MRLLADFSETYADADTRFVEAANRTGANLGTHTQPGRGPAGERLHTRVARYGPTTAPCVLFVESGTHGIEGYCGSGGQIGWMREGSGALPSGVSVVMIHAINPHGFAWGTRETVEGVDLNRNFIDHARVRPENREYAELHDAFLPGVLAGAGRDAADRRIVDFRRDNGEAAFMAALAKGQYTHAGGLYYGGDAPTWSNTTLRSILDAHAGAANRVGFIDIHSGLGPFGYGMPITLEPAGSDALNRVRGTYGDSVVAPFDDPGSLLPDVRGHALGACGTQLVEAEVTAIALEFGTYSIDNDTNTYRAMLWLRDQVARGEPVDNQLATRIRTDFRSHFYPQARDWKEMVWHRTQQVIRQGLAALGEV